MLFIGFFRERVVFFIEELKKYLYFASNKFN